MLVIEKKLQQDLESYCKINNLDVEKFTNDLLKKAFMIEKFGEKPCFNKKNTIFAKTKEKNISEQSTQEKTNDDATSKTNNPSSTTTEIENVIVKPNNKKRRLN